MISTVLQGSSVFVVEDEALIALDIETAMIEAGAKVVTAATVAEALAQIENGEFSAAIVDHALGEDSSLSIYQRLSERRIPFLIYSAAESLDGVNATIVAKPAAPEELVRRVVDLVRSD
ncbi:MAG: response regulator [Hyphomicrobiaceae bacterium]